MPIRLSEMIALLMLAGCVTGVMAICAGVLELGKIKNTEQIQRTADIHMYLAVTTLSLYSLSLFMRWGEVAYETELVALVTSGLGFIALIFTGLYGAELVYKFGVGVRLEADT